MTKRRRRLRGALIAGGVLAALAIAAAVAVPLGGWDEVELETAAAPELPFGERYEGRRFTILLESVELAVTHPDGETSAEPGERFLVITATIENRWRDPQLAGSFQDELVEFDGRAELDDDGRPDSRLASDGTRPTWIGPGIPTRLRLIWTVPQDAYAPGEVLRVGILDGRPDEHSEIVADVVWRDLAVVVEVPVVIEEAA